MPDSDASSSASKSATVGKPPDLVWQFFDKVCEPNALGDLIPQGSNNRLHRKCRGCTKVINGHEQQDAIKVRQDRLDVELHYDIEAALWDGEYVKASPFEEVSAFGDATDSQAMDLDAALSSIFG